MPPPPLEKRADAAASSQVKGDPADSQVVMCVAEADAEDRNNRGVVTQTMSSAALQTSAAFARAAGAHTAKATPPTAEELDQFASPDCGHGRERSGDRSGALVSAWWRRRRQLRVALA